MKILIDREWFEHIKLALEKSELVLIDNYIGNIYKCVEQVLRENPNPESTFPVYHSCPQCGKTIYLTDPHKCYTEVKYENIS